MSTFTTITTILIVVCGTVSGKKHIPCKLTWVNSGYGNSVLNPVPVSESDQTEYIGRFFHPDSKSWFAGRVVPSKGKIFTAGYNQELLSSVTYQVLTNPGNKCVLTWENGRAGNIPDLNAAVKVALPEEMYPE